MKMYVSRLRLSWIPRGASRITVAGYTLIVIVTLIVQPQQFQQQKLLFFKVADLIRVGLRGWSYLHVVLKCLQIYEPHLSLDREGFCGGTQESFAQKDVE